MPINKQRLREVREMIVKHKERFSYAHVIRPTREVHRQPGNNALKDLTSDNANWCGTTGCIAGFTLANAAACGVSVTCMAEAAEYLELPENGYRFLFLGGEGYGEPEIPLENNVDDALKRIDILLALPD